jgi:hypothetical protein
MRRFGQVRGSRATGQMDKLVLVGLGLLVVLAVQVLPFAGDRSASAPASAARAAITPTPARAPLPTAAPPEAAVAPAAPEEATATPEPAARPPAADPPAYRIVAGGAGANLRSAPSTSAPIVRRLRDGTIVTNLNQQQSGDGMTWRRVAENDAEGWVAAELLAPAP